MKKLVAVICILAMCLGLCSCGPKETNYSEKDYMLDLEYKKDFKILQLSDIHLANKDDRQLHYDYLDIVIRDADPDMIICDGDTFTFADKTVVKETAAFLDSYGIPWSLTFGNHDEQGYYSIDWLAEYLTNYGSNCVFKDIQDDDVYGSSNFVINLKESSKTVAQLILMDSNRYNYDEYWGYDYIKADQIDWYERMVSYTTMKNGGKPVPSFMFFHIPIPEFAIAFSDAVQNLNGAKIAYGEMNENVCCPKVNTGLFNSVLNYGSTKGIFCAHDHVNNWMINYQGVDLSYGVTSTDRIYYKEDMIGGLVIIIHEDATTSYERIYHSYEEVAR